MVIMTPITPTPTGIPTTLMTGALAYTWDTPGGQVQRPGGGAHFIRLITMVPIPTGATTITMAITGIPAAIMEDITVAITAITGQVIITDIGMGTMMDITMGIME